jgi:hypothetical protein
MNTMNNGSTRVGELREYVTYDRTTWKCRQTIAWKVEEAKTHLALLGSDKKRLTEVWLEEVANGAVIGKQVVISSSTRRLTIALPK